MQALYAFMSTKQHILHCQSKQKPKASSFNPLLHARNDDSWIHFMHKTNSFPLFSDYYRTQTIITNQSNAKKKKSAWPINQRTWAHKKKIAMANQILPLPTTLPHTHTHTQITMTNQAQSNIIHSNHSHAQTTMVNQA